jgi:hypothetical protein
VNILDLPVTRGTVEGSLLSGRSFYNFKPTNTRKYRNAVANARAGIAPGCRIACVGNSTTAGTGAGTGASGQTGAYPFAWPNLLKSILNARLAPTFNGALWGQANNGVVSYPTFDTRLALGAGWGVFSGSLGGPLWTNNSTTNALAFTPTDAFDSIDVYYIRNTGRATFTVDVDGGAALATINSAGTVSLIKASMTCARATHTINIKRTGVGTDAFIVGIVTRDSTSPAIAVWNMGWHGVTASTLGLTANAWYSVPAIAAVAPDLMIYEMGVTDMGGDLSAYKADSERFIASALVAGDVIVAIHNPVSTASHSQADQDAMRAMSYTIANDYDLPVIDHTLEMQSYTVANADGLMFDNIHPLKKGYGMKASLYAKALLHAAG